MPIGLEIFSVFQGLWRYIAGTEFCYFEVPKVECPRRVSMAVRVVSEVHTGMNSSQINTTVLHARVEGIVEYLQECRVVQLDEVLQKVGNDLSLSELIQGCFDTDLSVSFLVLITFLFMTSPICYLMRPGLHTVTLY